MTTNIKQLSDDMTASFKQLVDYQVETEHQIDARFNQVDARLDKIENDITGMKATMATKEDIATVKDGIIAMEGRILNTFQQLVTMINAQRPLSQ